MRQSWILVTAVLVGLGAFLIWAMIEVCGFHSSWTGGSGHILAAIIIGVVGVGGLTAALSRLAFVSARPGYYEPPVFKTRPPATKPDGKTAFGGVRPIKEF